MILLQRFFLKVFVKDEFHGGVVVLLLLLLAMNMNAQIGNDSLVRLYAVQSGFERSIFHVSLPNTGTIVQFTQKTGLSWLDINALTGRLDNGGIDEIALQDYFFAAASDSTIIAYMRQGGDSLFV